MAISKNLRDRILTGIVLGAVAVGDIIYGGVAFEMLVVVVSAIMLVEWVNIARAIVRRHGLPVPVLGLLGSLGAIYCGMTLAALLIIRGAEHGLALSLWTLAIVVATDVGAYFAGRAIGGPKLAPRISPNKTWAGLVGGMVLAALAGMLVAGQGGLDLAFAWAGAGLAVVAQLGDLFESWMKRLAGVKDSGRLIPGHGGVWDRIDGLVPVAWVVAALVLLSR
jgi:phosphatidate cytidylyltransferase